MRTILLRTAADDRPARPCDVGRRRPWVREGCRVHTSAGGARPRPQHQQQSNPWPQQQRGEHRQAQQLSSSSRSTPSVGSGPFTG